MADRTIKTRIKLLYKAYSEWQAIKDEFVPLLGEVCVVKVPAAAGAVVQEPAILFKVGDGESTFAQLGYTSSIAADVYDWAKKASLDWDDLGDQFISKLEEFISQHAPSVDTQYRIVSVGTDKWQLQKSTDGEIWEDATGLIDISAKVDKWIDGANGAARIFNEADGGGAKFEHNDGTWSFVGVNDGGADGIAAQIYAVDKNTLEGTRINVTKAAIYYIRGAKRAATADDEIVIKSDIAGLVGAMHFRGVFENIEDVPNPQPGDIALVGVKEYVYGGEPAAWHEVGDEALYETKADAIAKYNDLAAQIAAEINARIAADNTKVDKVINGTNGTARIFNEADGGGAKFEHTDGTEAFVGVNDGGESGMMAQIYADKQINGAWVGSRINVYHDGIYYVSKEDQQAGAAKNAPGQEIVVKKQLNYSEIEQTLGDCLILDCNL